MRRLSRDPATIPVLKKLRAVVRTLRPGLKIIVPAQTVCNYLTRAARNFSSELSEGDASGTWVRFTPIEHAAETLSSATPAEGLHVNPYPIAGQDGECETGAEPFVPGTQIGNPPGKQVALDPTRPPEGVPAP